MKEIKVDVKTVFSLLGRMLLVCKVLFTLWRLQLSRSSDVKQDTYFLFYFLALLFLSRLRVHQDGQYSTRLREI